MNARKTLLHAALLAAALAAGAAGAQQMSGIGGIEQQGGVATPSGTEQPIFNQGIPSGQNAIPRADNPQNPNEARPFRQEPEGVRPLVRGAEVIAPVPIPAPVPAPRAAYPAAPMAQPMHGATPLPRGDNPSLPNPVTPSAANESRPMSALGDPTNMTGFEGHGPVGATR